MSQANTPDPMPGQTPGQMPSPHVGPNQAVAPMSASSWQGTSCNWHPGSAHGSRILVIDDARSIRRLVENWLQQDGHRVDVAATGQDGLDRAIASTPDLILLDIDIPDRDGFDVCRALKSNPQTIGIPVIFLTANTDVRQKIRGLDLGAVDYIGKPFEPAEFRARVRAALRTKHLLDLLSEKAQVDGLTGLHNRRHLDERLAALTALMRRGGSKFSCIMADIDFFKRLNDEHGHAFGDEVLVAVAAAFVQTCRAEDVLCRYGGEELCVLTPEVALHGAAKLAERLRVAVSSMEFRSGAQMLSVTASFGVAEADGTDPDNVVRNADAALYVAKSAGRNCVRTYAVNETPATPPNPFADAA
ncbi:MAG: diguanylate cyclase [Planctomycetota bacterium]